METLYKIGDVYHSRGKFPKKCTIVDILKTYNHNGELVKIRYISTHEFMGQIVTDHDVCGTTIARGIVS